MRNARAAHAHRGGSKSICTEWARDRYDAVKLFALTADRAYRTFNISCRRSIQLDLDRMADTCGKTAKLTQCSGGCLDWWKNRFNDCVAPFVDELRAVKEEDLMSHPELVGFLAKVEELNKTGCDVRKIISSCDAACNSTCREQHAQLVYETFAGPNLAKQVLGANSTNDIISFDGYSGFVSLDAQGDMRGSLLLRNFRCQNETLQVVNVGMYEAAGKLPAATANYSRLQTEVTWPGSTTEIPTSWMDVCPWAAGMELDVVLDWIACSLLVLSCFLLVLIVVNKDTAIIRHSSWVFCIAMISAGILLLLVCFLFRPGILDIFGHLSCRLLPWVYGAHRPSPRPAWAHPASHKTPICRRALRSGPAIPTSARRRRYFIRHYLRHLAGQSLEAEEDFPQREA